MESSGRSSVSNRLLGMMRIIIHRIIDSDQRIARGSISGDSPRRNMFTTRLV
jgi:hypothetical protein